MPNFSDNDPIAIMAKHLPPSQAHLRLLDVSPKSIGAELQRLRPDIEVRHGLPALTDEENSIDAVVGYQSVITADLLATARHVLRPGGRLILLNPATADTDLAEGATTLEKAGFVRLLAERVLDRQAILSRGEKPYAEGMDTFTRVSVGAAGDSETHPMAQGEALVSMTGRYVHLLIRQTPNKPAWALRPDDVIQWEAVVLAATTEQPSTLLGFSSLPKAVEFMQGAVMAGMVKDVSKIAKFSKTVAATWPYAVWINPSLADVQASHRLPLGFIEIDPALAEVPDE